ncbi:MAG: phosphoribosylformylglycinamidine synthase subunit PurL [Syntrophomonadaceae bacterium]|nr:phosphoribosylformylglycinamidine synthase subunit PurL [Syntrophomonadaceae bacterium]
MTARRPWREMGLTDYEYDLVLKIMGREPNQVELGLFAVMWSEHCGYKNSRPLLKLFPTDGPQVIEGPGENAGVVDIGDGQSLVFKIESHNHPSAIEPYQGAATGVGGIVRDIFTMGARPIALLNSLRFGTLDDEKTRYLMRGVVRGIGDYGNCLGIPTVAGEVYFHSCYEGNPLVNAMCVGLVNTSEVTRAIAGEVGKPLLLVGAKTGRDGIHGATFASEELSAESESRRPAVQVGDPFMEKLLLEACLELINEGLVAGMQDLGAAGLISSVAETASKGGRGVVIDVQKVLRREEGMTPYEIMLSESQERMLIIPREGAAERIQEIFDKWGLDASIIGYITDSWMFTIQEGDQIVGEVLVKALTDMCPVYHRESRVPDYYTRAKLYDLESIPHDLDYNKTLCDLLKAPSIASKKWIYQQYDHQIMTNTVVIPGDGDAAVLRIKETNKGVAVTVDCNSRICYLDPFIGGMWAVCEGARNLACSGARPLAITNCLNFGSPEKPDVYWQMDQAVRGMAEAAGVLQTPVVSGNVSLYNETRGGEAIYPTPVVGMVGLLTDVSKRMEMAFKDPGDLIVLLGDLRDDIGGSEYLSLVHGVEAGSVPEIDLAAEMRLIELILSLNEEGLLKSCHDISEGGLAVCLAESAIKGNLGAQVKLALGDGSRCDGVVFGEAPSRVVVSASAAHLDRIRDKGKEVDISMMVIGKVGGQTLEVKVDEQVIIQQAIGELASIWGRAIECQMD